MYSFGDNGTVSRIYANIILDWLKKIYDEADAREFARIALDSLEAGAEARCESFDRVEVLFSIRLKDRRI